MENPIISVIIPVYNSQKTIVDCLESVLSELSVNSYSWELILVNDGSTDDSLRILYTFKEKSLYADRILIIDQPNKGAAATRNAGIKASRGTYIAFNDSDDKWLSGKLKLQMNYLLNNPEVVLIGGVFGQDDIKTIKKIEYKTIITIKDQVLKNYFSPSTVILRKKILEKSGLFCEKMRHAEEGYFFNNIVVSGKSVLLNERVTSPITSKKRYGDTGLSGNLLKMEQGELFNIHQTYKSRYISLPLFLFAYSFSIIKFFRRVMISQLRK